MKFLPDSEHEYEFQMVSFVDVIFVLLSFFVLGSQFTMPEKDFGLGYQTARSVAAVKSDLPPSVPVELRGNGGAVAIRVGQARLPDNDFGAIRAKLAEINLPVLPVVVLAEPSLSVDQVAKALDAVLASPMRKVSVSSLGTPAAAKPADAGATALVGAVEPSARVR